MHPTYRLAHINTEFSFQKTSTCRRHHPVLFAKDEYMTHYNKISEIVHRLPAFHKSNHQLKRFIHSIVGRRYRAAPHRTSLRSARMWKETFHVVHCLPFFLFNLLFGCKMTRRCYITGDMIGSSSFVELSHSLNEINLFCSITVNGVELICSRHEKASVIWEMDLEGKWIHTMMAMTLSNTLW